MENDVCSNGAHRMNDVVEALQSISNEIFRLNLLVTALVFIFAVSAIFITKRQ